MGRVPTTLIISFGFREQFYLMVSLDLVSTVSGNVFLCTEIYFLLASSSEKGLTDSCCKVFKDEFWQLDSGGRVDDYVRL